MVVLGLQGIIAHERYNKAAKLLTKANCRKVLDVGSAEATPLANLSVSIDVKRKAGVDVIADASHLPFRDHTFDCVTAIDVLEHIRPQRRTKAIDEMKRCGKEVLIHTPLQDNNTYMGKTGDIILFNHLKKALNIIDENTREHLEYGETTLG